MTSRSDRWATVLALALAVGACAPREARRLVDAEAALRVADVGTDAVVSAWLAACARKSDRDACERRADERAATIDAAIDRALDLLAVAWAMRGGPQAQSAWTAARAAIDEAMAAYVAARTATDAGQEATP